MCWKTVFQKYQNPEIGKKGKQVTDNEQQVSQFSLFPGFRETQKSNTAHTQAKIPEEIDMEKLKTFLGEDWEDYKNSPEALALWADLLFKNSLIEQGKIPDNFTATTYYNLCGYVYAPPSLVNGGNVLGCPWCWNRAKGLPIPKPVDL